MLNRLLRVLIIVVGFLVGPGVVLASRSLYEHFVGPEFFTLLPAWLPMLLYMASSIITGLLFLLFSKKLADAMEDGIKSLEKLLSETPSGTLLSGVIGLILGLVIAALISVIIGLIPVAWVSVPLTIVVYIIFGYLGVTLGVKRRRDLAGYMQNRKQSKRERRDAFVSPKILDTSVIIDGRIFDICKTGMFEGDIIVPGFVLDELRHIADSRDDMKRSRGRRGLDMLNRMQKELQVPVQISDTDYDDIQEVDVKLLRLAQELGGKVVTNDFNLNKVAAVQGVPIFNINELANAVKPILMSGEELQVYIVKEGKEANQGVGYLDDGTMIVVEGARNKVDKTLDVVVTSILQTAAGRMIFARMK